MASTSSRHCILIFFLSSHLLGVALFIIGFLLTRTVVPEYSLPCNSSSSPSTCLPQSELRFRRVVWVLVDALRYDFVRYDHTADPHPPLYLNQMPNINTYLEERPQNLKLYRFVADPPTTTMQRLKALTTGSLPTFVDIGSNFNSYEVTEDNLIMQCNRNGLRVTFMGDDTWLGLYPRGLLSTVYPYPSLNVKDLHTVDNGVMEHLLPELSKGNTEFIIGHLLGVDHCGHTYGPSHPFMKQKLNHIDEFLRLVFESVSNDTVIFVFGDHGMTATGDHGGETPLETDSALLIYSSIPLFDPHKKDEEVDVYQTDIVPSVSLLLGIPIPFSNLGMAIPHLFRDSNPLAAHPMTNNGHSMTYLRALYLNMNQLYTYLKALIHHDISFTHSALDTLVKLYHSTRTRYEQLMMLHGAATNETEVDVIMKDMIEFIRGVRSVCTEKWAKFNDVYIYSGICVLMLHLIGIIWTVYVHATPLSSIDQSWLLSICLILFHSFSLFSNSFIVFEQDVVKFSTQSIIVVLAYYRIKHTFRVCTQQQQQQQPYDRLQPSTLCSVCLQVLWPYTGILVCVRLSTMYHTCRDQQDECTINEFLLPFTKYIGTSVSSLGMCLRFILIVVSVWFYRVSIRHFEHTLYRIQHTRLHRTIFSSVLFVIARELIWIVVAIPLLESTSYKDLSVWLAWLGYTPFIIGLCLLIVNPWAATVPVHSTTTGSRMDHVYVSVSWLLLVVMCPIVLVVGVPNDSYILPLGLMIIQLSLTVRVIHGPCEVPLVTRVVICSLFVDQYFFGLGHQATVNSLKIEAGFVGLHGDMKSVTLVLAGVLVGLNTLASQVIGTLLLPLLGPTTTAGSSYLHNLFKMQILYIGCGSLKLVCTTLCASILRRHLMLWAVFGPRFLYEAAIHTVSIVMTILVHLYVHRTHYLYENHVMKLLYKRN